MFLASASLGYAVEDGQYLCSELGNNKNIAATQSYNISNLVQCNYKENKYLLGRDDTFQVVSYQF